MVFDATSGKQTAVCEGHRTASGRSPSARTARRLASAGEDRTARLWDPATGALLATFRGHTSKVLGVAFSPDGARLLTASADGTVRQWDAATGREVEPPYDRHAGEVFAAAYSPDGQWVASAGSDRTVRVWRATGRQDVAVLHGHTGAVHGVAFAPDGRRLASLSRESEFVWAGTARCGSGTWTPRRPCRCCAATPATSTRWPSARTAAGSPQGAGTAQVRLWDAATGEPCATLPHPGVVRALAFGPDGTWLVSGSFADDRLRIWDRGDRSRPQGNPGSRRDVSTCWPSVRTEAEWPQRRRTCRASIIYTSATSRPASACSRPKAGCWPTAPTAGGWPSGLRMRRPCCCWMRGRIRRPPDSVATRSSSSCGHFQSRQPPPRLVQWGPHRSPVAGRQWCVPGAARAHRRGLRGGLPPRRVAAGHGRPRPGRLAVGPGNRRGGGAAPRPHELRLVAGLQPRRHHAGVRLGRLHGSPVGHGALKARYQARREAETLRPEAERLVEQLFAEQIEPAEVVARLQADQTLNEPLRHAALRVVMRRAQQFAP